jgi:hypothetical protein
MNLARINIAGYDVISTVDSTIAFSLVATREEATELADAGENLIAVPVISANARRVAYSVRGGGEA